MSTRAKNRRLGFQGPRDLHDVVAKRGLRPPAVKIGEHPARALDSKQRDLLKSCRFELPPEILRPMKIRGREVVEAVCVISMLTVAEIAIAHANELAIDTQPARETVESRGASGNRGYENETRRNEDASRFAQRSRAVG